MSGELFYIYSCTFIIRPSRRINVDAQGRLAKMLGTRKTYTTFNTQLPSIGVTPFFVCEFTIT